METKAATLLGVPVEWPRELPGKRAFRRPHFQECYQAAWLATEARKKVEATAAEAVRESNQADFQTVSKAALVFLACADRLVATGADGDTSLQTPSGVQLAVEYYHFAGNNLSRLNQFERAAEFYLCSGLAGIALLRTTATRERPTLAATIELTHRSLLRARSFFRQSGDDLNAERAWVEAFELQRLNSRPLSLKRSGFEIWRAVSRYGTELRVGGWLIIVGSWALFAVLRHEMAVGPLPLAEAAIDAALSLLTLGEISGQQVPIGLRFANAVVGLGLTGLLVQLVFQKLSSRG